VQTQCRQQAFAFQGLGTRAVVAAFDGGMITSDAGALLLRELEDKRRIVRQFAACFTDHRDPNAIEFALEQLLAQRIFGLCCGYEDLIDHDLLRADALLAAVVGVTDPSGQQRRRASDRGKPLAGKSTLNRLELRTGDATKDGVYKKIEVHPDRVNEFFSTVFLQAHRQVPARIYLDLDATDDLIHGHQEGRFFHGYYGGYCYLPLYIFCGDFLLSATLRTSDRDASKGALEEVERIVGQLRRRWPQTEIVLRGDSGFCREELMAWCEAQQGVYYLFGVAKNARLLAAIERERELAEIRHTITGKAERVFGEFVYKTLETWSRARRVIGKAEHLEKGANPRFVVTSLPFYDEDERGEVVINDARHVYERLYCARGEMENRIKEQQLDLFADRTSATMMAANQLRLWLSSVAYVVMNEIRRVGLDGTKFAQAQCGTIREKVLKIGARVRVSVRRVAVSMSSAYPYQDLFAYIYARLSSLEPLRC
jgi:Transposase DDE domain group 1